MTTAIENILANTSPETLDALEEAVHAGRRNTIATGGVGQTREEMARAEELLAHVAIAQAVILAQVDEDLEAAKWELQENGIDPSALSIEEILGDDYPALPYI